MTEHDIQRLLVAWFRDRHQDLAPLLFAIPNGGKRGPATAKRLKAEGVLPGIPDLCLAVPSSGRHGLWLELKTSRGRTSPAQRAAHEALRSQGYAVEVAHGYEAAKAAITDYLETKSDGIRTEG